MKPVIGLTAFTEPTPQKKRVNVSYHYIESIEMVGGIPMRFRKHEKCLLVSMHAFRKSRYIYYKIY